MGQDRSEIHDTPNGKVARNCSTVIGAENPFLVGIAARWLLRKCASGMHKRDKRPCPAFSQRARLGLTSRYNSSFPIYDAASKGTARWSQWLGVHQP